METVKISIFSTISSEQMGDFDQTCADTLLGGDSELIRFF